MRDNSKRLGFLWYTHLVIETTFIFRLDDPETTAPAIMISSPHCCLSRLYYCFEVQLRSLHRMTLWPLRGLLALSRHPDSPEVFALQWMLVDCHLRTGFVFVATGVPG